VVLRELQVAASELQANYTWQHASYKGIARGFTRITRGRTRVINELHVAASELQANYTWPHASYKQIARGCIRITNDCTQIYREQRGT
jgi:hypothetical protein